MADTGIFATTAEVLRKCGAGVSSVSGTEAYINDFIAQAESYINVMCRENFSDTYTTLNVDVKGILKEAASNLVAIYIIMYDMSGITLREAENRINILWARFQQCIRMLNDRNSTEFISGGGV